MDHLGWLKRLWTTRIVVEGRFNYLGVSPVVEDLGMLNLFTDLPVDAELTLTGRFEPCHGFRRDVPGSPVCGGCGWLDTEHPAGTNVRGLPKRAPAPRRLAS